MAEQDLYILHRLDQLADRLSKVEKQLSATLATLETKLESVTKWQVKASKRVKQVIYGLAALSLTVLSKTPEKNINEISGLLKALKSFMEAVAGISLG